MPHVYCTPTWTLCHAWRNSDQAKLLLLTALFLNILIYATAAVGTIFATVGLSKWVAVTVAFSILLSRTLQHFRVNERRIAEKRAAAALSSAKLKWQALPREMRARQVELDRLVQRVEAALEATLPPALQTDDDEQGD